MAIAQCSFSQNNELAGCFCMHANKSTSCLARLPNMLANESFVFQFGYSVWNPRTNSVVCNYSADQKVWLGHNISPLCPSVIGFCDPISDSFRQCCIAENCAECNSAATSLCTKCPFGYVFNSSVPVASCVPGTTNGRSTPTQATASATNVLINMTNTTDLGPATTSIAVSSSVSSDTRTIANSDSSLSAATGTVDIQSSVGNSLTTLATNDSSTVIVAMSAAPPSDSTMTALIGGIVGGVVALLLVVGLIVFIVARKRSREASDKPDESSQKRADGVYGRVDISKSHYSEFALSPSTQNQYDIGNIGL
jgi:hypothetical protein